MREDSGELEVGSTLKIALSGDVCVGTVGIYRWDRATELDACWGKSRGTLFPIRVT